MTKRWEKIIRQLQTKKYRKNSQQFLVEGSKLVEEAMGSNYSMDALFYTQKFYENHSTALKKLNCELFETEEKVIRQNGTLKTNDGALAVVKMFQEPTINTQANFTLVLDDVRDPGNLGTILRIADWFAIDQLICSENTVDLYNPKTVAASMGSIFRTKCIYTNLTTFLEKTKDYTQSYGAFMEGKGFHGIKPKAPFILVMGNESNGIQPSVEKLIQHKITIPKYGKAESLNVAIATGILCDYFKKELEV